MTVHRAPSFRKSSGLKKTATSLAMLAGATGLVAGLLGCAADVPMESAVNANDPACADVTVRLPKTVGEMDRRYTNAQATGAWGTPAAVLLRCGIEPSGPTTDTCVNVNGVDWVIDRSNDPIYRFEAYGRTPGIEVIVDSEKASGTEAVVDLAAVVKFLPQERQCSNLADTLDIE